jgi:hypothetical protein
MRWTDNKICAAAMAALAFALAPAALAEPMVIKYQGPAGQNYKPGKKLQANQPVTLKAGETLTVLDERGTRTLRGPGTFSTSSAPTANNVGPTSLASLIKTSSVRRARTGAVRGTNTPKVAARSPNLWFVDISKSGTICVPDFSRLQLWRADTAQPLKLTASSSLASGTANFLKGQPTASWPNQVTPVDGGRYTIMRSGGSDAVTINLVQLTVNGDEALDKMASNLLSRGCQTQGELLAETFAQADPVPISGS